MSRLELVARIARRVGAAAGVVAVGTAAGLAAERATVHRTPSADDPYADEAFHEGSPRTVVVPAEDGVPLHVEVDEPRRPPPGAPLTVVLSHGYALNLDCWHFQRRALADVGRLVLWDQRSHGRSGRGRGGPHGEAVFEGVSQLGRDLGRVLAAVAPSGPVVLVGHSMGGMATLSYARQHPAVVADRVVGVGLLCTSAGGLDRVTYGVPGPLGRLAHRLGPAVFAGLARQPDLVERGRRAGSDLGFLLTKRYSFASDVPPSVVEMVAEMNAATPIDVLAAFLPIFDLHDERGALDALVGTEALVVGAAQDKLVPVDHARALSRALPGADYLELDPCGHMAMLEYPDVVSTHLRSLVDRARRVAAAEVA